MSLPFFSALTCLPQPSFSGVWYGMNGFGESPITCNVVCLSHGNITFYWAFLPMEYYEDDFFLSYTVLIVCSFSYVSYSLPFLY